MAIGMAIASPDHLVAADQADQAAIDAEFLAIVLAEAPWALGAGELAPPRTGARRPPRVVRPGRGPSELRPRVRLRATWVDHRRPVAVARSPPVRR